MVKQGTTEKYLHDYLFTIRWGTKKSTRDCKEICDFTGRGQSTVRRWFTKEVEPIGIALIKIRYFLESKGYIVSELEQLDPRVRDLGLLIAHNVISVEVVSQKMGYSQSNYIFRVLHGELLGYADKVSIIEKILKDHEKDLRTIKQIGAGTKVNSKKFEDLSRDESSKLVQSESRISEKNSDVMGETLTLIKTLGGLVSLLEPRLELLLSDGFTPEERQQFRDMAGKIIFDESNRFYNLGQKLNASCSETARKNKGGN